MIISVVKTCETNDVSYILCSIVYIFIVIVDSEPYSLAVFNSETSNISPWDCDFEVVAVAGLSKSVLDVSGNVVNELAV